AITTSMEELSREDFVCQHGTGRVERLFRNLVAVNCVPGVSGCSDQDGRSQFREGDAPAERCGCLPCGAASWPDRVRGHLELGRGDLRDLTFSHLTNRCPRSLGPAEPNRATHPSRVPIVANSACKPCFSSCLVGGANLAWRECG